MQPVDITEIIFYFSIQKEQAKFSVEGGKYFIEKSGDAKVMKNGLPVTDKTELHHTDRSASTLHSNISKSWFSRCFSIPVT